MSCEYAEHDPVALQPEPVEQDQTEAGHRGGHDADSASAARASVRPFLHHRQSTKGIISPTHFSGVTATSPVSADANRRPRCRSGVVKPSGAQESRRRELDAFHRRALAVILSFCQLSAPVRGGNEAWI
jgi:hypothetical protein